MNRKTKEAIIKYYYREAKEPISTVKELFTIPVNHFGQRLFPLLL